MNQMNWKVNRQMGLIALAVFALDQFTKLIVLRFLGMTQEQVVVAGFFKFVHWENSGAAWSLFHNRNWSLAGVSVLALIGLYHWRRHFYIHLSLGRLSLGLIFGGIVGNLFDRIVRGQVIDFLRFYLIRHSGDEIGFPAFNIADSAICIGVGLLILVSWKFEEAPGKSAPERPEALPDGFRSQQ
jgi:signal peptidase II